MKDYIVKYSIGKNFFEILIVANNEKQAEELAGIQIRATKRGASSLKIIGVRDKDDPDPVWDELDKFRVS